MGDHQRDEDVFSDTLSNRGDLEALVNAENPQGANQPQPREGRVHRSGFTSGLNPELLRAHTNASSGPVIQPRANVNENTQNTIGPVAKNR